MIWTIYTPATAEMLGIIPQFLSESDPRSAREQLHSAYAHEGGWQPFDGFELAGDGSGKRLEYPCDRPMSLIGETRLRDETIAVFEYSWVAIIAADGTYEIARMD